MLIISVIAFILFASLACSFNTARAQSPSPTSTSAFASTPTPPSTLTPTATPTSTSTPSPTNSPTSSIPTISPLPSTTIEPSSSPTQSPSTGSYQQMFSITSSFDRTTRYFNIPADEWRLTWSYTPSPVGGTYAFFYVHVYPEGETIKYIDYFYKTGNNTTSGSEYIHQGQKEYYLEINVANIDSYTITAEVQKATPSPTSTLPEFPTWIILPFSAITILLSILFLGKRITKNASILISK